MAIYYVLQDTELTSLQLLVVMNLANIFLLFFIFFIFIEKRQPRIIRQRNNEDENILATYEINFDNILNLTFSDTFPYNDKCSICLEDFTLTTERDVVNTLCNHYFHNDCIKRWLRIRTNCPNCNQNLIALFFQND